MEKEKIKKEIEKMIEKNKYDSKIAKQQEWQNGYYNALKDVLDLFK